MPSTFSSRQRLQALALSAIVTGSGVAVGQPGSTPAPAAAPVAAQAQQEREACLSGRSGQDQATCLREAAAAREAAKKGNLESGQGQLQRNRTDRCEPLQGADRSDCYARMRGEGSVEGSVKGGGILREKRTVIPAAASAQASGAAGRGAAAAAGASAPSTGASPAR